jgi:hypothetical protein
MDLRQPDRVEAPFLRGDDLVEAHREGIRVGLPRDLTVEFVVPANFHGLIP